MGVFIDQLILRRQLSAYVIVLSLAVSVSAAMMYPGFIWVVPINAAFLFMLRWIAHREGARFW